MEAKKYRNIQDGKEYDALFPSAMLKDEKVKRGATVADTVKFIPKVVHDTLKHTHRLSPVLKGKDLYSTCKNIWNFVYNHIRYTKDQEGLEQVRSPARSWHDRFRGVDCDCYTVFISSVLTNLKIPHILRITKYGGKNFQHIYPVVQDGDGQIVIDCVVDKFNYEEPYTEKKDTAMELQYLNGLNNMDYGDLSGDDGFGKLFKKKDKTKSGDEKKRGGKIKEFLKKGLNVVNKVNPATVLLRNGILAAMKLNMFKIAQRLKWSYLSEEDSKKKDIDMVKWKQLVQVREKLEKIFYGAGGKTENLKSAILTGKGNKNKEVSGLGEGPTQEDFYLNTSSPLRKVIGEEIWLDENVNGVEGLEGETGIGELGEVVAATAITAASGVLAAIGGLLKSIGSIFKKKDKGSEDFENTESEDNSAIQQSKGGSGSSVSVKSNTKSLIDPSADNAETSTDETTDTEDTGEEDKPGFWTRNKKWLKPTLIGLGGLGLLYGGYRLLSGRKRSKRAVTAPEKGSGLDGTKKNASHSEEKNSSGKKKNYSYKRKKRSDKGGHRKKSVALL